MINHYYGYKDSLGGLITEFSLMRDRIADIYRRRSLELIDLFGDRIKAVDPELFDFARIEWLDVRAMQEAAHLHYDQVVQSSLVAMRRINDSFNQRGKQSLEGFNNGIGAGLISLGLNFVGHHLDSIAITHELRAELENFKLRLHSDATTVQTDVMRLFTIYKALNDVAIPRAKKFHEFSDRVFDHSFQTLVDAYYNRGNLNELRQKRNEKLKDLHEAEQFVSRHRGAIEHHRTQAEGLDENLKGLRRFYKRAKSARPTRWPAFFNLLTFGIHNHNYEERYRQWYEVHGALYEAYREMEAQHKEHRREVKAYGKKLAVVEKEKLKFQAEVNGMSLQIRRADSQAPINTPEIAARLGDVVRLLRLAREITQTSLDERLLKATVPYQFNQVSMPTQSQRALSQLQAELQTRLPNRLSRHKPSSKPAAKNSPKPKIPNKRAPRRRNTRRKTLRTVEPRPTAHRRFGVQRPVELSGPPPGAGRIRGTTTQNRPRRPNAPRRVQSPHAGHRRTQRRVATSLCGTQHRRQQRGY